jgi:hypothetical protein
MITLTIEIHDMQQLQDVLRVLQPEANPVPPQEEKPKPRTKKKAAKKAESAPQPVPEVSLHTEEDVREMATKLAGKDRDALVALLGSVGAAKVSELSMDCYNEFMDGAASLLKAESDG